MNFNNSLVKMILTTVFIVTSLIPGIFVSAQMRIYQGRNANFHKHAYVVSLQNFNFENGHYEHFCGGSLITPKFVMTAAHCFSPLRSYAVKAGTANLKDNENGLMTPVSKFVIHPEYNTVSLSNDIALALLAKPFDIVKGKIELANIPKIPDQEVPLKKGIALGWGVVDNKRSLPELLQYAHIPVVSIKECETKFPGHFVFVGSHKEFCVLDETAKRRSVCIGDSGGPFEMDGTVVGITSSGGHGYCNPPGYFTQVSSYLDFINDTIKTNNNEFSGPTITIEITRENDLSSFF